MARRKKKHETGYLSGGFPLSWGGYHPRRIRNNFCPHCYAIRGESHLYLYAINHPYRDLLAWEKIETAAWDLMSDTQKEMVVMSFLKKVTEAAAGKTPKLEVSKETAKRWPALVEHLLADVYPGTNQSRKRSTITLFFGASGLTACLNDKDNDAACFMGSDDLVGLLDALEAAAKSPDTVWKHDRNKTGHSGRKKS